ncbi:MAG: 4-alpha-glucanotransferase, partial [Candidatus Hadarchaeales archaeon]
LPIFSLPSPFGVGDLGPSAYRFVDFLSEGGQSFWQVLPIFQLREGTGNPYLPTSAFAGNVLLLSPELLVREGLLDQLPSPLGEGRIEYPKVWSYKMEIYRRAFSRFRPDAAFEDFCSQNSGWLEDYAIFRVLERAFGSNWIQWPFSREEARRIAPERWEEELRFEKFLQYLFFKQWFELREYARSRGVGLIGDLPFYFPHQSAEVWSTPHLFKLKPNGEPSFLSGVPGDFFNPVGQFWGTPVYAWEVHRAERFDFWIRRIQHCLKLFDLVRLDHCRAFVRCWEVPAGRSLAEGSWKVSAGIDFFLELRRKFGSSPPVFGEDLGTIIAEERGILDACFPTIRVLLIAFSEEDPFSSRHAPHNYPPRCVGYTSTHDMDTILGWFQRASQERRRRFFEYVGREVPASEVHTECLKLVAHSEARLVIFSLQDVLGLGSEARINRPGFAEGNWEWRLLPGQLSEATVLRKLAQDSGRL